MEWARILAYITGTVDQELLLRNEYLAAENGILKAQLKGRPPSERSLARLAIDWAARRSARWRLPPCRTPSWHGTEGSLLASSMDRGHVEPQAGHGSTEKLRN
jgi:hypothetical protein